MSKQENIEQFDHFFKESLENASIKAPSGVWEGVSSQIGASGASAVGATGVNALWIKTAAILVVAAVSSVVAYNSMQEEEVVEPTQEEVIVSPKEELSEPLAGEAFTTEEEVALAEPIEKENTLAEPINNANPLGSTERKNKKTSEIQSPAGNNKVEKGNANGVKETDSKNKGSEGNQDQIQYALESLEIKSQYCKGEPLEIKLSQGAGLFWYVDGKQVGEGATLTHQLTSTGKKKVVAMLHGKVIYNTWIEVITANTSFRAIDNGHGEFQLMPEAKEARYVWNVNDGKGYRSSGFANLGFVDYAREQIPVTLIVTSKEGCVDSSQRWISNKYVTKGQNLKIPNAFTPGNDGYNDKFVIDIEHETYYHLLVKNVKGETVFESKDKNVQWDGTCNFSECPEGVYYYIFNFRMEGSTEMQNRNGKINLIKE